MKPSLVAPSWWSNNWSEKEINDYKFGDFATTIYSCWYFPPFIGSYTRVQKHLPFPDEIDFRERRIIRCFYTATKSYEIRAAPKHPTTFAEAAKVGVPDDYHERLKRTHQQKLKNCEYAVQYLKSGHHPKPLRKTHELGFLYIESKKLKKNEIRSCLRAIGIDTGRVIDINFAGNNITVLTVPREMMGSHGSHSQ